MKKRLAKQILSVVLSFALVLACMPLTAGAANISPSAGVVQKGHYIYFGSSGQKWRVLDSTKTSDGKNGMFLFSQTSLGTSNTKIQEWDYAKNGLKQWCTDYLAGNFSDAEKNVMLQTTVAQSTGTYDNKSCENYALTGDRLFLLSAAEAANSSYFSGDNDRKLNMGSSSYASYWFLRTGNSSGSRGQYVAVHPHGDFTAMNITTNSNGVKGLSYRPGFNLDTSKVLFITAATGGKTDGLSAVSTSGNEWKLTLADDNSFADGASVTNATACAGGVITVNHKALLTVSSEYNNVTAAIFSGDTMLYYGSVNTSNYAMSSEVTVPGDLAAGNYTLKLYGEDWNGDKKTDIATGTPYSVGITVREHEWEYATNDKTGTMTASCGICGADGGSVTLTAGGYYTGEPVAAAVSGAFTNGATYTLEYDGDSSEAPTAVGDHTVTLKVRDSDGKIDIKYTVSYLTDFTPPDIQGGYVREMAENDDVRWFKADENVTVKAPAGYTISKGLDGEYEESVTLEPSDDKKVHLRRDSDGAKTNAINLTGAIKYDGTAPQANISFPNSDIPTATGLNTGAEFTVFSKDSVDVSFKGKDPNGSGMESVKYYVADRNLIGGATDTEAVAKLEAAVDGRWVLEEPGCEIRISPEGKYFIYAKFTDGVGNVSYVSSTGIVLYSEAESDDASVESVYLSAEGDESVAISLNGNTVREVKNGNTPLTRSEDYEENDDGIVLKKDYLNSLPAGTYTFTVSYNALGEEYNSSSTGNAPTDTAFTLVIGQANIGNADIVCEKAKYTGEEQKPTLTVTYKGVTLTEGTDYTVEWDDGAFTDAKTYNAIVTGIGNFAGETTVTYNIQQTALKVTVTPYTGQYDREAHDAFTIDSIVLDDLQGSPVPQRDELTVMYYAEGDDAGQAQMPQYTKVGTYKVRFTVSGDNFETYEDEVTVEIEPGTVEIDSVAVKDKVYDGGTAAEPDLSEADLGWEGLGVTAEGTFADANVGEDIQVTLTNYELTGEDADQFVLTSAPSETTASITPRDITVEITPNGGVFAGDIQHAAAVPVGAVEGDLPDITLTYTGTSYNGEPYESTAFPVNAGEYTVTATLSDTPTNKNYNLTGETTAAYLVEQADPQIGNVTAGVVSNTLELSAVQLNRAYEGVTGTLAADAEQTLAVGDNVIAYTFTPDDKDYKTVTGTVPVHVEDTNSPYGDVIMADRAWYQFLHRITFGLFFNQTEAVVVKAADEFSGVAKVEYYESAEGMTEDAVKALSDTEWTAMELKDGQWKTFVTAEDAKRFVYYIRITDNYGNVAYLSTDGAAFDMTLPVITGAEDGDVFYTTQTVTVTDANIDTVYLNDTVVTELETIVLEGDVDATYVIQACDKARNVVTVTVTMKPISAITEQIDVAGLDGTNVTSEYQEELESAVAAMDELLQNAEMTETERGKLEEEKRRCEEMLDRLAEALAAAESEGVRAAEGITSENVELADEETLRDVLAELEGVLDTHGANYTEGEYSVLADEACRIEMLLETLDNANRIIADITALPETVEPDDETTVRAIEDAMEDYFSQPGDVQGLIDPALVEKLEALAAAAVDYRIVSGDGNEWTEDTENDLHFKANGPLSKFAELLIDGSAAGEENYAAESGSTLITLKAAYLNTLSVGEHTLTVRYTDGEADCMFFVLADRATTEGEPGSPENNGDPDGEESSEPSKEPDGEESSEPSKEPDGEGSSEPSEEPDDEESSEPSEEPDGDTVPETGDASNVHHWAAVLFSSIMAMAVWVLLGGKKAFGRTK